MAEQIRRYGWTVTPLGPVEHWRSPLRIAVQLMLAAPQPMLLFWGPDHILLHNDAARALAGVALGRCGIEGAPALMRNLARVLAGDTVDGASAGGWTASCSPVPDEAAPSGVGGVLVLCVDNAAHRQRLTESEARFRAIADAAPVMMWVTDETGACTWCNAPWLRFTGRTLERELGCGWTDLIHPDDRARHDATLAAAWAARMPFRLDFRLRRSDGQWRVVDDTGAPRLGEDGTLLGFVGSCLDVTRQRETEARFRGVFNSELMGMTVFDANTGATLAINDCFLRMTGHSRVEFDEGRWNLFALMHPDHAAADAGAIQQARQRGWWDTYDTALRRCDGTAFAARISSAPLPNEQGRVVIAVQDITAEHAAQAALVASEEQLRLGLEAGRMVTWDYDLETCGLHRSANCEAIFGPGDWPDDYVARIPEADRTADRGRLAAALADPEGAYDSEFRYDHPSGIRLHLHNRGRVTRDAAGKPVRVHGVCLDISERKRAEGALTLLNETLEQQVQTRSEALLTAEEALRQAQKMEALGQLTGGVAHDFNNLLGAMVGNFDLIRSRPEDVDRVRRLAEDGLRAAERGAKLTSQLLTFSRGQRIELKPVRVDEVVAGLAEMLRRTLGPLVALEIATGGEPQAVMSDPTQLELAILNLAINGRDAMQAGGTLKVATGRRRVDDDPTLPAGDYIEVLVRDTGIGMSAEVTARAFDPFFTTKGVGKGTGLGLSQVYGLARQSGGAVAIESEPGLGTRVRLLLPCTDVPVTMLEAEVTPTGPALDATVLLVDDDPDLRQVVAALLDDLGFRVLEAEDGATGLRLLEQDAPDVMIVDFAMPGMTGAELATAARAIYPDLPIVFASGYADTNAIGLVAGPAAGVLHKPFRIADLRAALDLALAGRETQKLS